MGEDERVTNAVSTSMNNWSELGIRLDWLQMEYLNGVVGKRFFWKNFVIHYMFQRP